MEQPYEIEYKYLADLSNINYQQYPFRQIEQAYISTSPTIRIRRQDDEYFLTVKGKGMVKRLEFELPISQAEYTGLKTKIEGRIISKRRYLIPYRTDDKKYRIELDIFEGDLAGLVLAEVEFLSLEDAKAFQPPVWFLENVSSDPQYHNASLSQQGKKS